MSLLEVEDLTVTIPTPEGPAAILNGLSFALEPGEQVGIVGESGCGKSMTALAIMRLLPERARLAGRIRFDGQDLVGLGERALCRLRGHRLSMIFQEPMTALNPVLPIGRQILESVDLHLDVTRHEADRRLKDVMSRVGLPPDRFSPALFPHQLSGGQRQRVMVAMALVCRPALLIADEPTTALDVTIQRQILELIADVVDETGMALLLITHDLGVIAAMTDRMMVMYAGHIVERGRTVEVFDGLLHPYSRGLFEAVPKEIASLGGERPRLAVIPGTVQGPLDRPPGCPFAPRCPRVQADCRERMPPLERRRGSHACACFHPHDMPPAP